MKGKIGQNDISIIIIIVMLIVAFALYFIANSINIKPIIDMVSQYRIWIIAAFVIVAGIWFYLYNKFFRKTFQD